MLQKLNAGGSLGKIITIQCPRHGEHSEWRIIDPKTKKPVGSPVTCPKCRDEEQQAFLRDHKDEIQARMREQEAAERREKERLAAEIRQKALERALSASAIPLEYEQASFDTYRPTNAKNAEALRQAKLFAENFQKIRKTGVGLFLYGTTGTGKSHIACSILKALMPDVDGVYCMTWQIIKAVKDSDFGTDPLAPFINASLLVLDEVGVQYGSKFEETSLYPLIDMRVALKRPTIFISNMQPDAKDPKGVTVRQTVGERIWDRMQYRSIFLQFTGPSYRKRFKTVDELLKGAK